MYADNTQPAADEQANDAVDQTQSEGEVVSTESPTFDSVTNYDYEENSERQWPALIIYSILAIAVAILVVFGGRWVYNKVTDNDKVTQPPVSTNTPPPQPSAAGSDQQNQQPQSGSAPSTSQNTPSTGSQPAQGQNNLPSTGPGSVAAIAIAASLAAAGLHFIFKLRRAE